MDKDDTLTCWVQVDDSWFKETVLLKTFTMATLSVEKEQNAPSIMTCTVTGLTVASINVKWIKEEQYTSADNADNTGFIVDDGTLGGGVQQTLLEIDSQHTELDDVITCLVEVDKVWYQHTVDLKVFELTAQPFHEVQVGHVATLSCKFAGMVNTVFAIKWVNKAESKEYTNSVGSKTAGYTVTDSSITNTQMIIKASEVTADKTFGCCLQIEGTWYCNEEVLLRTFTIAAQGEEVKNGTTGHVTCTVAAASAAPSSITWKIGGNAMDANKHTVKNSEMRDSGEMVSVLTTSNPQQDEQYTCIVDYHGVDYDITANLNVFGVHLYDSAVLTGENLVITCHVDGNTDNIVKDDVVWTDGDSQIVSGHTWDNAKRDSTLTVNNIMKDTSYSCAVKVEEVWYKRSMKIDVFDIEPVGDVTMTGITARPHCRITGINHVTLAIEWSTGSSQNIAGGTKTNGYSYDTLNIDGLTDDEMYTCNVKVQLYDTIKSFSKTAFVDFVQISAENLIQSQDKEVTLTCEARKATRQQDMYSWDAPAGTSTSEYITNEQDVNSGLVFALTSTINSVKYQKHEGTWTCNFKWVRSAGLSMTRNLEKSLYLDVPAMTTTPSTQYVQTDSQVSYECLGRTTTSGRSVAPTYTWEMDGVAKTGQTTNGKNIVTVAAAAALDGDTIICTATWKVAGQIATASLTSSALLFSKNTAAVAPAPTVYAVNGESIALTCTYRSLHKGTLTVKWFKDSQEVTNMAGYSVHNMTAADDYSNEITKLIIISPSTTGMLTCKFIFTEGVGEYKNTFNLKNVMGITLQPTQMTSIVISGYSTLYKMGIEGDSAISKYTYEWFKNGAVVSTTQSTATTSTYSTGQVFYRTDKNNQYKCRVTWQGTYQTLVKESSSVGINMIDSCKTSDTTNFNTKVTQLNPYVVHDTSASTECTKGWILPTGTPYFKKCVVDNLFSFTSCEQGCYIPPTPSRTTYKFGDTSKLAQDGYTTIHKDTDVTLQCDNGYTLRKSWSETATCSSPNAGELTFTGHCHKGCALVRNSYTKTPYTAHGQAILAQQDGMRYTCEGTSMTSTGATSFSITCTDGNPIQLNQCNMMVVGDVHVTVRTTSVYVELPTPSYPSTAPDFFTVSISDGESFNNSQTVAHSPTGNKVGNKVCITFNCLY